MFIEENKEVARKCIKLWGESEIDLVNDLFDDSYVGRNPNLYPQGIKGPEALKEVIKGYRAAFSDTTSEILSEVAEGDKVVVHSRFSAIQKGNLGIISPTGKRVSWTVIAIYRFKEGKVIEDDGIEDFLSLLQQVGFVGDFLD